LTSASLRGTTNVWLARMSEKMTINPPVRPNTPTPGTTKISISMSTTPLTNRMISSCVAV
jgi:hypothetical protein